MLSDIFQWIGVGCLLLGSLLTFIAATALLKFPDLLSRQHAATKPQVLGLILMVTGAACVVQDPRMAWTCVLVIAFQMVTSPISAHMLSRAGYRTGRVVSDDLTVDELGQDLADTGDRPYRGTAQ